MNRYGVSEMVASMTKCSQGRLHTDMEFGIVEVEVMDETDEWERGPLFITGLSNDATPFIRHRIGDVGTRLKKPCPCGCAGDVFLATDGRIEDYVKTSNGRLIDRLDHIFKKQTDIAEAHILQSGTSSVDVFIVPKTGYSKASARQFLAEIRARLGIEIDVRIEQVAAIPREANGKFRAVKSRVGRLGR